MVGERSMPMLVYMAIMDDPGDCQKFRQIYLTYKGLMFYVANQILHNTEDSEDAVHEAFIVIAKNIKRISGSVCPKTKSYIVNITESKAIDLYRKNKKEETAEYIDEIVGISVENPEANALDDCILKLPARYREVILMKYSYGFSCREIAEQFGITLENANKLDQRAKKKLMKICKEEGLL